MWSSLNRGNYMRLLKRFLIICLTLALSALCFVMIDSQAEDYFCATWEIPTEGIEGGVDQIQAQRIRYSLNNVVGRSQLVEPYATRACIDADPGLYWYAVESIAYNGDVSQPTQAKRVKSTSCALELEGDDSGEIIYTWLLAERGSLRDGYDVTIEPGEPVNCSSLGVDRYKFSQARWLAVVRRDERTAERRYQNDRLNPTGLACAADGNGDGLVNMKDFASWQHQYNADTWILRSADLNGDGLVNFQDVAQFRAVFNRRCVL